VKIGGAEKYLSGKGCEVPSEIGKKLIDSGLAKQTSAPAQGKGK